MSVLSTRLNTRSAEFDTNRAHMQAQVDDLRALVATLGRGGDEKSRDHCSKRGLHTGILLPEDGHYWPAPVR